MSYNRYLQVSEARYDVLCKRFKQFMLDVEDITKDPFKFFDPLNAQQIQELELIREVSKDLQNKKEEDRKKAAEAALEAEKAKKELKEAEKTDETKESKDNENETKENEIPSLIPTVA